MKSNEFTQALRTLRLYVGLDQKVMAKILGISAAYYNDLERGGQLPSMRIADALAQFECKHRGFDHALTWFIKGWHALAAKAHGWNI